MKTKLIIAVLLIIGIVAGYLSIKSCHKQQQDIKQVTSILAPKIDTTTHFKDENGQQHAKDEAYIVSLEVALAASNGKVKEQAALLHLRENQIKDMIDVMASDKGSFEVRIDTYWKPNPITGKKDMVQSFRYADSWIDEEGEIRNGKADIDYQVKVPINLTTYWKRKWFLGKKKYFIDGTSANPNVVISGLHEIMIKDKMPGRFGIGPYIGIDANGKFSVGLAANYSLIRF